MFHCSRTTPANGTVLRHGSSSVMALSLKLFRKCVRYRNDHSVLNKAWDGPIDSLRHRKQNATRH